jgi:hypothetical protein
VPVIDMPDKFSGKTIMPMILLTKNKSPPLQIKNLPNKYSQEPKDARRGLGLVFLKAK